MDQSSCGPTAPCPVWEACNIHLTDLACVPINDCSHNVQERKKRTINTGGNNEHGCASGEICCGGGPENCVCPSPKIKDKKGKCRDCDCPWNERCTSPHGDCVCDEHQVRKVHNGPCVNCDPELSCPKCGPGRICHIHQGNLGSVNSSTCECLPGSVEKDGECTWCRGCPKDCKPDQVCVTPGFTEPYCGCPPGKSENDGKCVHCPRCPDCYDSKVCVVKGSETSCECPSGTIPHGDGCLTMPHPVFNKRVGPRNDNMNRGKYGSSLFESGHYGSGHYGDYQKFNHGTGPIENYFEGSGPYQGGPYGSGPHESGSYGSGPHGSGSYGSGPHESGSYGSGQHGSGSYGSGHHGSGSYGSRPYGNGLNRGGPYVKSPRGGHFHGNARNSGHNHRGGQLLP